ncbi:hypothetical protein J6590_033819 [Homalodisca vitripennis]|nr:hypothetical protein J6590_033819 [Homalodisca vitripennis]
MPPRERVCPTPRGQYRPAQEASWPALSGVFELGAPRKYPRLLLSSRHPHLPRSLPRLHTLLTSGFRGDGAASNKYRKEYLYFFFCVVEHGSEIKPSVGCL